jgi:hypothetical protein
VTGVDLLAGAAVGYLLRKARTVAAPGADEPVNEILAAGADRVCELITQTLGGDSVLELLDAQARAGTESERTVRRAQDAIAERLEADQEFRRHLELMLGELALGELANVPGGVEVSAPRGVAAGRDVTIRAESGGVAAGVMESVTVNPPLPDPALV